MATTELGPNTVSTVGELPAVGSQAPGWDLVGLKFQPVTDADAAGKRVVLNIFPSIDTGVCQASVRKFNELAAGLDNTTVVNVSVDLPLAQARFCGAEGIEDVEVGSAFRSSFGRDYGVEMADGGWQGMLARAVVVLDTDRTVLHTQLHRDDRHRARLRRRGGCARLTPRPDTRASHSCSTGGRTSAAEEHAGEFPVAHRGTEEHRHREPVPGTVHDLDRGAGLDHARLADREVGTRAPALGEPAHPRALGHVLGEGRARHPRPAHLEQGLAHAPLLPHLGLVDGEPGGGEVLAERPVAELAAEVLAPPVELLARDGVDRLRLAAVVLAAADVVADHTAAEPTLLGAGVTHLDPVDGTLADPARPLHAGHRLRGSCVDGEDEGWHGAHASRRDSLRT